jgi:hypothetical protein
VILLNYKINFKNKEINKMECKTPQCSNTCEGGNPDSNPSEAKQTRPCESVASETKQTLILRPYELLCTICSLGEEGKELSKRYDKYKLIREAVRKNPDIPITLNCHAGDLYAYQDSGTKDDTPEGEEFNRKRDLDVLQILDLTPGCTLPARALFSTLIKGINTVSGICGYNVVTGEVWKGCSKVESGNYERGYGKGIKETWYSQMSSELANPRKEEEMVLEKQKSIQALNSADVVTIRPHILVCAVCQYGDGLRPPYKEDNLPELLDLILNRNPDILIRMAFGADLMMCSPCPGRNPELNSCTHVWGSGELASQKRDLDLLQKLGLKFGSTMKARELYKLIFERVTTTHGIPDFCLKYNSMPSIWWDNCSGQLYQANPSVKFIKGKRELMKKLNLVVS